MEEKTPLMTQYASIKKQYPNTLLLFQVGDFYEFFGTDAQQASAALGITLTKRGKTKEGEPIPLCGIPVHTLDFHLKKLITQGFTVALCDQLEPAKPGILVKRGITRIFTPGTLIDNTLLSQKTPSYLMSIGIDDTHIGITVFELLTSTIHYTKIENTLRSFEIELNRFCPDEVIIKQQHKEIIYCLKEQMVHVTELDINAQNTEQEIWFNSFDQDIKKNICSSAALSEAFTMLHYYVTHTKNEAALSFHTIIPYTPEEYLILDHATRKNLELVELEQSKKNTLFDVLDHCMTAMGSRLLKKWILFPLCKKIMIEQRLRITHYFFKQYTLLTKLRALLHTIGDFERIIGRISLKKGSFSDYIALKNILFSIPEFLILIKDVALQESIISTNRLEEYKQLQQIALFLDKTLHDDTTKPYIIKDGYNKTLDEVRSYAHNAQEQILLFEQKEQQKTGINSLKIRHHPSYGYVIEITKTHLDKIPDSYQRIQTLVGKERYISDELHILSNNIERASKQMVSLEEELFFEIKTMITSYVPILRHLAFSYALFDVYSTFAYNAHHYSYCLPEINEQGIISIKSGRHPVIEHCITHHFIPNDVTLNDNQFFIILTGPNMGGKSTYLRQIALMCLMAHIGSFVPAKEANITMLDRIFTRVGGHDNVTKGESTFLVEMKETAIICTYATNNSLVLLDEVGRGTSIKEGMVLAQAIVEYLYNKIKARALFATHYHELAYLTQTYPHMKSFFMETKTEKEKTLFLHNVVPGICLSSFALEVAHLAELPHEIIQRARALLKEK